MITAKIVGTSPAGRGDEALLQKLQADIEALADIIEHVDETHLAGMVWSRTRPRGAPAAGEIGQRGGTPFTTLCNGRKKAETAPPVQLIPLPKMARFSLTGARRLRKAVVGSARLVWRDFTYEPGKSLWIRLAFEALD